MCSVTSFWTSLINSYIFLEFMFFQVKNHCNLYEYFIIEMKNTKYAFHLLLCAANKLKLILIINEVTIELPILSWWIYEQCRGRSRVQQSHWCSSHAMCPYLNFYVLCINWRNLAQSDLWILIDSDGFVLILFPWQLSTLVRHHQ